MWGGEGPGAHTVLARHLQGTIDLFDVGRGALQQPWLLGPPATC